MQIFLVELTFYLTEKCRKNKFTVSFLGKTPLKLKKYLKKSNNFTPVLAASTAALVQQLLACYCGSTTLCRWNGNYVDPKHPDS